MNNATSALVDADSALAAAINVVYLGYAAVLVVWMAVGFALLETGSVSKTNTLVIMLKNFLDTAIGIVVYYAIGWAMAFGDLPGSNGFNGNGYYFLVDFDSQRYMEFFFQYCFSTTTATIVSGALAERLTFQGYMIYAAFMQFWIQPIVAHWFWSSTGWLSPFKADNFFISVGVLDFAGGGAVHMVGGMAALGGLVWAGYRNQYIDAQTRAAGKKRRRE